mgnify:CR=1 FL=1
MADRQSDDEGLAGSGADVGGPRNIKATRLRNNESV